MILLSRIMKASSPRQLHNVHIERRARVRLIDSGPLRARCFVDSLPVQGLLQLYFEHDIPSLARTKGKPCRVYGRELFTTFVAQHVQWLENSC